MRRSAFIALQNSRKSLFFNHPGKDTSVHPNAIWTIRSLRSSDAAFSGGPSPANLRQNLRRENRPQWTPLDCVHRSTWCAPSIHAAGPRLKCPAFVDDLYRHRPLFQRLAAATRPPRGNVLLVKRSGNSHSHDTTVPTRLVVVP